MPEKFRHDNDNIPQYTPEHESRLRELGSAIAEARHIIDRRLEFQELLRTTNSEDRDEVHRVQGLLGSLPALEHAAVSAADALRNAREKPLNLVYQSAASIGLSGLREVLKEFKDEYGNYLG